MNNDNKPSYTHAELAAAETYAVDEHNDQVTVMNTMGQDPNEKKSIGARQWLIVFICTLAVMQGIVGAISAGSNQFAIVGALGDSSLRTWLVQGAAVPSIVVGPIVAVASDIYGRRWIVISLWVLALVSSIMGATAHSTKVVVGAQILSGFSNGVGGLMFSIVSEVVPAIHRTAFQTLLIIASSISSVIALIGIGQAVIADPVNGWRWQYYILIIMNSIVTLGFLFFYFPPTRTPQGRKSFFQRLAGQDWVGYFLLCAGLVPFVLGFTWAGTGFAWHNPHVYSAITVGGIFLIVCGLWEWKGTSHGFLDHRLFRNGRNFPLCCFLLCVEGSLFYLMNNIYTQEVATLWNTGDITTNAYYLPYFLVSLPLAPVQAWYVRKRGDLKWPLVIGFTLFFGSMIGLALCGDNKAMALGFDALAGVGFTAPLILLITMVQLSTPPLFIGTASSIAITCRTLGGIVSLAIATAIFGSKTNEQIPAALAEVAISMGVSPADVPKVIGDYLSHNFAGLAQIPGVTGRTIGALVGAANKLNIEGFKLVWLIFLPGGVIAIVCSLLLVNPKDRFNWVVDAPLSVNEKAAAITADDSSEEKA